MKLARSKVQVNYSTDNLIARHIRPMPEEKGFGKTQISSISNLQGPVLLLKNSSDQAQPRSSQVSANIFCYSFPPIQIKTD